MSLNEQWTELKFGHYAYYYLWTSTNVDYVMIALCYRDAHEIPESRFIQNADFRNNIAYLKAFGQYRLLYFDYATVHERAQSGISRGTGMISEPNFWTKFSNLMVSDDTISD